MGFFFGFFGFFWVNNPWLERWLNWPVACRTPTVGQSSTTGWLRWNDNDFQFEWDGRNCLKQSAGCTSFRDWFPIGRPSAASHRAPRQDPDRLPRSPPPFDSIKIKFNCVELFTPKLGVRVWNPQKNPWIYSDFWDFLGDFFEFFGIFFGCTKILWIK